MTRAALRSRVGLDYRPALVNGEGIGRYVRGLVRGYGQLAADPTAQALPQLALFGWTLARSRFSRAELGLGPDLRSSSARLARLRVPSGPALGLLEALGRGIDDVPRACGGPGRLDLFHHTQYRRVPVRRAREVCTLHDLCFFESAEFVDRETAERMSAFARDAAARAAAICVPTEFVARDVSLRLGVERARLHVTPLGCDHVPTTAERPRAGPAPDRAPYVLTVSRVDLRKNHLGALRAFEWLAARGRPLRWIVAGAPGFGHQAFAAELERSPAPVEWRRDVPERELLELYDRASVYLAPAFEEGFGLTPLEAARRDLPVVAAQHPVAREVLEDAACFADPRAPEELALALESVLEDAGRAAALVAAGRARSARYTWSATAAATLAAWTAALGPESRSEA